MKGSRIVSVNGGTTWYAYDAANRRVWKGTYNSSGAMTAEEAYFYGVSGQKLGTYSLVLTNPPGSGYPNYAVATDIQVFFGGKRVGHGTTATPLVVYATTQDRVGSVQNAGLYFSASSFYPYGEEKSASPGPNDQMKFATYTRDSETGLDYAMNRYYSSGWGRFGTPDPYRASGGASDPQSWNRYSYTRSDPINRVDPAGTDDCNANFCVTVTGSSGSGATVTYPTEYLGSGDWGYVPDIGFDQSVEAGLGQAYSDAAAIGAQIQQVIQSLIASTGAALVSAAEQITHSASTLNSQDCQKDLAAISARGGVTVTTDSIMSAASQAGFNVGYAASAGGPPVEINGTTYGSPGAYFASNPGAYALTFIGQSSQYWMTSLNGTPVTSLGGDVLEGAVMHELLHSIGFTDSQLQRALGYTPGPDTDVISSTLAQDCFHF